MVGSVGSMGGATETSGYIREAGVKELGSLGSGRHPSHSTTPAGPGDEVARGIAGEKFDIVKKWGINTYKVGFKHLSLSPDFPWVPFPHLPDSTLPSLSEMRSLGMLG